jgi:ribosome maturation factor RimP
MKPLSEQIEALITPTINGMGFGVVQVKLIEGKNSRLLQIMAERPDGSMSLDDCTAISHQVSALMDVEDIIPTAYRLEVGSPGIDRPLRKEAEFAAYAGHTAKVETVLPVNGRKRFTGEIKSAHEGQLLLTVDKTDVPIPIDDIQSAKLVLTDALIKAHQQKKVS